MDFKFGKIKDVRIVQYRNGRSKGMAYVEFEEEQAASKALLQTDGILIGENQISVAISNPPKRNLQSGEPDEDEEKRTKLTHSLGSGSVTSRSGSSSAAQSQPSQATGVKSASTAMAFVPRSQQLMGRKKTLNLS